MPQDPLTVALLSVLGTLVAVGLVAALLGGSRLGLALKVLRDPSAAAAAGRALNPPPPEPPKPIPPPKPSAAPVRFLALLQREGRLLDFLTEDIQAYDDAQVGAAVREIHRQCRAALQEHLEVEPVLPQDEGATVEVPPGFDPSAVRLTGNVTGSPPFRGTLVHRGWRLKAIKLAAPPEGQDEFVLQPAEVNLP